MLVLVALVCQPKALAGTGGEVPRIHSGAPVHGPGTGRQKMVRKLEVYDALKIAVAALRAKGWMPEEYRLTVSWDSKEKTWLFWFVWLPGAPGMDVTVFVDERGETHFLPGK